jgi:hypothetical protein
MLGKEHTDTLMSMSKLAGAQKTASESLPCCKDRDQQCS